MSNPRVRKIADRIQVIVAEMLERRIKDPRLGFVTVTDVRVSGDTQQATVFYTVSGEETRWRGTAAALESAKGLIRSEVGKQLGMRHVPSLEFIHDALPETARHLDEVLAQAREPRRGGRRARRGAAYAGEPDPYKQARASADELAERRRRPAGRDAEPGWSSSTSPAGMTSHDVVARVRRLAGTRKVGHAGTLDPMATGVLVLGVGRATRLLGHLILTEKAYDATIRLGAATTTDDAEGERSSPRHRPPRSTRTRCGGAARRSSATSTQVPSAVSAIKVDGKRAYARVRDGEQVDLPARRGHCARAAASHEVRPRRRAASTSTSRCAAPAAPTCVRSPATSARRSASAAT